MVALAQQMICIGSLDTVRVTKVKGHATDADVAQGWVRIEDKLGIAEADTAADIGRRHQTELLIDARCSLLQARTFWYPGILQLQRFMIAVSRVAVNHDGKGCSAPDPLVWDQGGPRKVRKTDIRINVDLASLPGPCGFLHGTWMRFITGLDVAVWPKSVGILCKFTAFLGSLHWPVDAVDMGHFGVSFLEVLILFEQWAGHRLLSEKVTRPHIRPDRPFFNSLCACVRGC